jgi:phage terminase large subunit GpA-like protein
MFISRKAKLARARIVNPPERLKISEWAEKYAYIPREGNSEPGKFRLARMPHEWEMLDDPMEPGVRETIWMLASQAGGKTMCLILICEYIIRELMESIIMVRTTKSTAGQWMRKKFMPTIRATPCMKGLLKDPRKRDSESTTTDRTFPGGTLRVIGAKSPSDFRSDSAGKILCDEIDAYAAGKEGDAIALAERAAITFWNAWKIKASTPTLVGASRIHEAYLRGDQRKYFIPCCRCGQFQDLKTDQLKFTFTAEEAARLARPDYHPNAFAWEIGDFAIRDTKRAIYVCEHCHHGWTDQQRIAGYLSGHPDNRAVVVNGAELRAEWRATAPFNGIRSRHLNGMYLTIGLKQGFDNYLQMFAEDFLTAKHGGRETLMVWTNIFKSEPFEDESEKLEWQALKDRAEDYGPELPAQVVAIFFGMDIQADRVQITFWGWGHQQEVWALERLTLFGDFDLPEMQDRVSFCLTEKRFKHPVLGDLALTSGGIDSRHKTQAVYQFCAKHVLKNFFAVMGFNQSIGVIYKSTRDRRWGAKRFDLNTDHFKDMIYSRLQLTKPGPRYIHFPKEEVWTLSADGTKKEIINTGFDDSFYTQLCSERKIFKRTPDKRVVTHWEKLTSSTRNEELDNFVYACGAYDISKQDGPISQKWKEVQAELRLAEAPVMQPDDPAPQPPAKPPPPARQPPPRPQYQPRRPPQTLWRNGLFNPLGL